MCIENATYLSLFLFDMVAFHALNVIRKSMYACMNSSWEAEQVAVTYPLPPPLDESTSPSAGKEFQVSKATNGNGPRFFFPASNVYSYRCTSNLCALAPFVSWVYVLLAKCRVNM